MSMLVLGAPPPPAAQLAEEGGPWAETQQVLCPAPGLCCGLLFLLLLAA